MINPLCIRNFTPGIIYLMLSRIHKDSLLSGWGWKPRPHIQDKPPHHAQPLGDAVSCFACDCGQNYRAKESYLREKERFFSPHSWRVQSDSLRTSRLQEFEAAGQVASTVREWREINAGVRPIFSFSLSPGPTCHNDHNLDTPQEAGLIESPKACLCASTACQVASNIDHPRKGVLSSFYIQEKQDPDRLFPATTQLGIGRV